jgi:hypothetical protein
MADINASLAALGPAGASTGQRVAADETSAAMERRVELYRALVARHAARSIAANRPVVPDTVALG